MHIEEAFQTVHHKTEFPKKECSSCKSSDFDFNFTTTVNGFAGPNPVDPVVDTLDFTYSNVDTDSDFSLLKSNVLPSAGLGMDIYAGDGADTVDAGAGDDTVYGDAGNDI